MKQSFCDYYDEGYECSNIPEWKHMLLACCMGMMYGCILGGIMINIMILSGLS